MNDYNAKDIRDIYLRFDTLFKHGYFVEVAQILQDLDIKTQASGILVTYVAASNMAQEKYLEEYNKFFHNVKDILNERGGDSRDVLAGLRPLSINLQKTINK